MKGTTKMAITLKQIDNKIDTFTTNRDKLKALGHEIAMMIIRHAAPAALPDCDGTGDCTRALKLAKAMPNSWEAQLVAWFKEYTPIRIVTKNDKCEYDPKYKALSPEEKLTWWKIEDSNTTPFYDFMAEPKADKVYDFKALVEMVTRLGKQIEKKIEDGKVKPEDVADAMIIATTVEGLRFQRKAKVVQDNNPPADTNAGTSQAAAA